MTPACHVLSPPPSASIVSLEGKGRYWDVACGSVPRQTVGLLRESRVFMPNTKHLKHASVRRPSVPLVVRPEVCSIARSSKAVCWCGGGRGRGVGTTVVDIQCGDGCRV